MFRALAQRAVPTGLPRACPRPQSEYVAKRDKRRAFISGFTGSAGTAVITLEQALLWTDGRYFAQAGTELDGDHWTLMRDRLPDTPSIDAWLSENLEAGSVVGVDPGTVADSTASTWSATLAASGMRLEATEGNPVDEVWDSGRPAASPCRVQVQPDALAGMTVAEKLSRAREALSREKAGVLVVAALDEVAWLLNLRGVGAIEYNPVFPAFCLVAEGEAVLCTDEAALTAPEGAAATAAAAAFATGSAPPHATAAAHLAAAGVTVRPYDAVSSELSRLAGGGAAVLLDPASCNWRLGSVADASAGSVRRRKSPLPRLKAIKTAAEQAGFRACHVRDALAVCRAFAVVEAAVASHEEGAGPRVDECTVVAAFRRERASLSGFQDLSFGTIAGSGGNGAVIHYSPSEETAAPVGRDRMLLVDSGGQYFDGTTDITRTVHMGAPTERERRCYTRVLQGHIALASAVFPSNTPGGLLDSFARRALWADGLDYRHGTGHGVGSFLNVHEGPHGVSPRGAAMATGLVPGMTVTDEPGYYEGAGKGAAGFGIRIEDILLVTAAEVPGCEGEDSTFCRFETFDVAPISPHVVEPSLLEPAERAWLDAYNARVRSVLRPLLEGSVSALEAGAGPAAKTDGGTHHTAESERAALRWMLRHTEPVA